MSDDEAGGQDPVELPIDGTLDLHAFRPEEVKDLVPEWLDACRERGILEVRIVHGKGTGALRRTVESLLAHSPAVLRFVTADEAGGGWGATLASLKRRA
jgi:DNA-nicking Smr family endonuclease